MSQKPVLGVLGKALSAYLVCDRWLTNGPRMKTHQFLTANGIPCTVVLDSAVAYVMERVDMVLVGSEAVVESGVCRFL